TSLDIMGMHITMCPGHHFIPAWAMRFMTQDESRTFGYSSDTSLTDSIVDHLQGVNLLLAESSVASQNKPESDHGHLTGHDAGVLARKTGTGQLVLTHYPQMKAQAMAREAEKAFGGTVSLAVEGQRYTI
ncbi:MAG TPA: MBL fold metallo-hydrolase, partial [Chloroflexota bacterium]|nr:MBL fold metallo-hydrolase [Chloroflexota bacterium]